MIGGNKRKKEKEGRRERGRHTRQRKCEGYYEEGWRKVHIEEEGLSVKFSLSEL